MKILIIFAWIYLAMIALAFSESYVEGRNAWDKGKVGWKIKIRKFKLTSYHFFMFVIMLPMLLFLPLVVYGWNTRLFGILISAYLSGLVIEDFFWYIVNPVVKFRELYSDFSDYYPWVKIQNRKIIPFGYIIWIVLAILSWLLLWR